jgi:hypothetical protein
VDDGNIALELRFTTATATASAVVSLWSTRTSLTRPDGRVSHSGESDLTTNQLIGLAPPL